jgi:hypothetical protein
MLTDSLVKRKRSVDTEETPEPIMREKLLGVEIETLQYAARGQD